MSEPIKVEIWSDIACPWCYLGKRRFEAAAAQFAKEADVSGLLAPGVAASHGTSPGTVGPGAAAPDSVARSGAVSDAAVPAVDVSYHSFQLSPELPADFSGSHAEYLAAKLGWSEEQLAQADQRLQGLGAPYGIAYNFDANRVVNTNKAHQLLHYARAHGAQAQVNELLFKAFFSDGVDLGRIENLADVAQKAGLDRADALRSLESGEYAGAVEADKAQAGRYGISGVPFFVIDGKYGLSGAQEPEVFLKALRQAAAEKGA